MTNDERFFLSSLLSLDISLKPCENTKSSPDFSEKLLYAFKKQPILFLCYELLYLIDRNDCFLEIISVGFF